MFLGSQMLVDLGQDVYQEEYERHLLAEAVTWYRLEAAEFVASSSCPDYLRKVRHLWWHRTGRLAFHPRQCSIT